jgi:hypothetical protein
MSTYPPDELMRKWTQGDLTPEQAIGHIVQHLQRMQEQHAQLVQFLRCVEAAAAGTPRRQP